MNNVSLIGRIANDLELKIVEGDKKVVNFTLAVKDVTSKKDKTDFIPVSVWGAKAENLTKYQGKGSLTGVTGSIHTGSFEAEGGKKYTWEITASDIQYLDKKDK